ncbi:hypothetical protein WMR86_20160 (plasmid) [Proteus vulgaris]|uniref:hypothetical protein n=1 Tax=Morganellaceae TaxID=1903414 RepID=UPI00155EE362|nr:MULTISPECIES: hypothetical protein [Morganellaceae]QKG51208.1 hypothetical protein HRD56_20505 [Proteus mirabilis]QNN35488.1 hypothetical protein H9X60_22245 [Providencia rettgeri]
MSLSPRELAQEKRKKVVLLIAKFGFSTRKIVCDLLGTTYGTQSVFFKKMISDNLIIQNKRTGFLSEILTLSQDGFDLAKYYNPDSKFTFRRKLSFPNIVHALSIQQFLVNGLNKFSDYQSESELSVMNFHRRPDLMVITRDDKRMAIEIELNQKGVSQIEYNFFQHYRDWKLNRFDSVCYVFDNEVIMKKYISIFSKDKWKTHDFFLGKLKETGEFDPAELQENGVITFLYMDSFKF